MSNTETGRSGLFGRRPEGVGVVPDPDNLTTQPEKRWREKLSPPDQPRFAGGIAGSNAVLGAAEDMLAETYVNESVTADQLDEMLKGELRPVAGSLKVKALERWGTLVGFKRFVTGPLITNITGNIGLSDPAEGKTVRDLVPKPEQMRAILEDKDVRLNIVRLYPKIKSGEVVLREGQGVYATAPDPTKPGEFVVKSYESQRVALGIPVPGTPEEALKEKIALDVLRAWLTYPRPRTLEETEKWGRLVGGLSNAQKVAISRREKAWEQCKNPFTTVRKWHPVDKWPTLGNRKFGDTIVGLPAALGSDRLTDFVAKDVIDPATGKRSDKRVRELGDLWEIVMPGKDISELDANWPELRNKWDILDLANGLYDKAEKGLATASALNEYYSGILDAGRMTQMLMAPGKETFRFADKAVQNAVFLAILRQTIHAQVETLKMSAKDSGGLEPGQKEKFRQDVLASDWVVKWGIMSVQEAEKMTREVKGLPVQGEGQFFLGFFEQAIRNRNYLIHHRQSPASLVLDVVIGLGAGLAQRKDGGEGAKRTVKKFLGWNPVSVLTAGVWFTGVNLWANIDKIPAVPALLNSVVETFVTRAYNFASLEGILSSPGVWMTAITLLSHLALGGRTSKTYEEWHQTENAAAKVKEH